MSTLVVKRSNFGIARSTKGEEEETLGVISPCAAQSKVSEKLVLFMQRVPRGSGLVRGGFSMSFYVPSVVYYLY